MTRREIKVSPECDSTHARFYPRLRVYKCAACGWSGRTMKKRLSHVNIAPPRAVWHGQGG